MVLIDDSRRRSAVEFSVGPPLTESAGLRKIIEDKRSRTDTWVGQNFPGYRAAFFDNPHLLQYLDSSIQYGIGDQIANVIVRAFGDEYPYANKHAQYNYEAIRGGQYFPYLGFIVPDGVSLDDLFTNPDVFNAHKNQICLASTASFLADGQGYAELARDARRQTIEETDAKGFHGGVASLSRVADWLDDRNGLKTKFHTLFSQIRAAQAHGATPSSAPVQNLQLKNGDLRIVYFGHMFNVGNVIEPDYNVERTRDPEVRQRYNRGRAFHTFPGEHINHINALWRHQLGEHPEGLNIFDIEGAEIGGNVPVTFADHGENIYGFVTVADPEVGADNGEVERISLARAIKLLDDKSPSVIVKVPAESWQSVAVQKYLAREGFSVCGVKPALSTSFVRDEVTYSHQEPISIYFTRYGKQVRTSRVEVVPTLFQSDIPGSPVLYEAETEAALRAIDRNIREQIGRCCA